MCRLPLTTLTVGAVVLAVCARQLQADPVLKGISHCHIGGSNPPYTCVKDLVTLGASWFYTWSATPPQCNASGAAAEWVPQINSLVSGTHEPTPAHRVDTVTAESRSWPYQMRRGDDQSDAAVDRVATPLQRTPLNPPM